jgi:hypothetical protein
LVNAEQFGDFSLFKLPTLQDQANGVPNLGTREKFIGVGEDLAAFDFEFGFFSGSFPFLLLTACLERCVIRSTSDRGGAGQAELSTVR